MKTVKITLLLALTLALGGCGRIPEPQAPAPAGKPQRFVREYCDWVDSHKGFARVILDTHTGRRYLSFAGGLVLMPEPSSADHPQP